MSLTEFRLAQLTFSSFDLEAFWHFGKYLHFQFAWIFGFPFPFTMPSL